MNKFEKKKIAIVLACASILGDKIQAINMNTDKTKSPQTLGAVGGAAVTGKRISKPLIVTFGALAVCSLGGFTIWGLTRNKNDQPDPKKQEKPNPDDKLKNKSEQNKFQDHGNNEIEQHNMKLLDAAIENAKNEGKLFADKQAMRNAILAVFNRIKNERAGMSGDERFKALYEICNNRQKMRDLSFGKMYNEDRNYVLIDKVKDPDKYYQFYWRDRKRVVVTCWIGSGNRYVSNDEYEFDGEDVVAPFEF